MECAQAAAFLVVQALIGLAVLLQFNRFAVATGIASLVIVAVYPVHEADYLVAADRAWAGVLMGRADGICGHARPDRCAPRWCLRRLDRLRIGYDTIYAHQDAEDDALIGIKSTALLFGARTRPALMAFYGVAVVLTGAALAFAGARWLAWIGLAAFAAHLVWQIRRLEISDPALCLRILKSNRDAGLLLFAGLLADAMLRAV